jgi:hypothetical protein
LFGFLLGYPIFAFLGYWAILLLSNNQFDRGVEACTTARDCRQEEARVSMSAEAITLRRASTARELVR